MSGFTPGPWVIEKDSDAYCIASVGNLVIMPSSGKVKHDNTEADARLIAAAPELLRALDDLLIAYCDPGNQGSDHDEKVEAARAALAKARGTPC